MKAFLVRRPVLTALTAIFLLSGVASAADSTTVPVVFPNVGGDSIVPADAPALKNPKMRWAPKDFAKDPSVIRFNGKYLMYFSLPPQEKDGKKYGWTTGIAESENLVDWTLVANLLPMQECDKNGLCAPCARVFGGKVYLFYQTYGNGANDAICSAVSDDGVHFTPNPQNPIFRPNGDWTNGRAIDAEVVFFNNKLFLYAATRDPQGKIQKLVVATADPKVAADGKIVEIEKLGPGDWKQAFDGSILEPQLPWETRCIEAATTLERGGKLYLFYAGGYNNDPQHIGLAVSDDGISWRRVWNIPFITNGPDGQWNASESGHPGVFVDDDGQTWLFFQGNATKGKDWRLSRVKIGWKEAENGVEIPFIEDEN